MTRNSRNAFRPFSKGAVGLFLTWSVWAGVPARAEEPAPSPEPAACASAEECFRYALAPVPGVTSDERRQLQSERLRYVRQYYSDSVWSQRAGIALALVIAERDPMEAARLFVVARSEVPILEDYVRYWEAEARLRAGETTDAAQLFEAVAQSVPDSLLRNKSTFAAGQAWFKAADCGKATPLLQRAVSSEPQDSMAPTALLSLADCQLRQNAVAEGRATLKQIWVKFPNTPAAREAFTRLNKIEEGGTWHPSAEDMLGRAQAFANLMLHAEAVDELQRFLATVSTHPRRDEAKLKLAMTLMRLKRYEQARALLQELMAQRADGVGQAVVALARIYLRQNDGEHLLQLREAMSSLPLSSEQRASVLLMAGIWLDDQQRFPDAIAAYRESILVGASPIQRAEAWWRTAWIHYRNGRWAEAIERFDDLLKGRDDLQWNPQALYWKARALERQGNAQAVEAYQQVCRQYTLSYYCHLARGHSEAESPTAPVPVTTVQEAPPGTDLRNAVEGDSHFKKAQELKLLRRDPDMARELGSLTERYGRDRAGALMVSSLLSEAGAHYEALRLARQNFRDSLERGGDQVSPALWTVAYPTAYLPAIKLHTGPRLDPYLAAAIIREESQYDARAVSRSGALGLMQLMPETARTMARRLGSPDPLRDDLFNQEINIRYGTRYLDQLVEQFSGNAVYAIAAYNAGPVAVSSWIAKNGASDAEEFVEMVPYQETRQYVKRVLRSYWEYRRVNGEPCRGRLLDKVC